MSLEGMSSMEQDSQANQCQSQHAQRREADGADSQLNSQEQVTMDQAEAAQNQMMMASRQRLALQTLELMQLLQFGESSLFNMGYKFIL